jgi:hypothetical protein
MIVWEVCIGLPASFDHGFYRNSQLVPLHQNKTSKLLDTERILITLLSGFERVSVDVTRDLYNQHSQNAVSGRIWRPMLHVAGAAHAA